MNQGMAHKKAMEANAFDKASQPWTEKMEILFDSYVTNFYSDSLIGSRGICIEAAYFPRHNVERH